MPPRGPQFSLRGLMLAVAAASGVCGTLTLVHPLWSIIAGWLFLLIVGHVAGNSFSTHVGRYAPPRQDGERPLASVVRPPPVPASRLHEHVVMGKPMFITAGVAALLGCVVGFTYAWHNASGGWLPAGLFVAAASSAVIGALFGFLTGSCLRVSTLAIHEACRDGEHTRAAPP